MSEGITFKGVLFHAESSISSVRYRLVIYTNILSNQYHIHVYQPTTIVDLINPLIPDDGFSLHETACA